jgi:xylose isomerase
MDAFARGLLIADKIIKDGVFDQFIDNRYSSYSEGVGKDILSGKITFEEAEKWILENGLPTPKSGRQEMLENILNDYLVV